jgi:predicted metalloprotease with PDZ domain
MALLRILASKVNRRFVLWIGGGALLLALVLFAGGALGYQLGRAQEQQAQLQQPQRLIQLPPNLDALAAGSDGSLQSTPFSEDGQGLNVPRPLPACDLPFELQLETPRAFVGVLFRSIDPQRAESEALSVQQGALIESVFADTPADAAGLQAGDIITAVDGKPIDQEFDLRKRIAAYEPGDSVELSVLRGETMLSKPITLTEYGRVLMLLNIPLDLEASYAYLGVRYEAIDGMLARDEGLALEQGALVREVIAGGPAQASGLRVGDIITAVDGEPIDEKNTLQNLIFAHMPEQSVQLTIQRADDVLALSVTLGKRDGQPLYQLHVPGEEGPLDLNNLDLCPPNEGPG